MMMKRLSLYTAIFLMPFWSLAGDDDKDVSIRSKLKQLVELRLAVLNAPTEEERVTANQEFLLFMRDALNHPHSFETAFDTIPQIADLRSGDGYFRMINWNLPLNDQSNKYFCFIQYYDKKDKIYKVIELRRGFRDLKGEYRKVFSDRDWYGALYYKIIPSKSKGGKRKRVYMLLGWDGRSQYSSLKVIDVLTITNRGVKFGADIFDYPHEKNIKRFIIEYKSDASVSLKYDERKKRFVFNQLVPMQPDLEGMYEFYIPVLQFDAFEWKKRKWTFVEDVEVKASGKDDLYNDPPSPQNLR